MFKLYWQTSSLSIFINANLQILKRRNRSAAEQSPWWIFIYDEAKTLLQQINNFIIGEYRFQPMITYKFPDETTISWSYSDRLFVRALLYLIKPTFKYIISPYCFHLQGPSGVKKALLLVQNALEQNTFRYFLRIDIKSYYASIERNILIGQLEKWFCDLKVRHYLQDIVNCAVIQDGAITVPTTGIPRRSSLSPFFGALYLSPLDRVFEDIKDICYVRYVDDILILAKTKKQFCRAKKRLREILQPLKLEYSRRKSKVGALTKGFHFLGIDFTVNSEVNSAIKEAATQIQSSKTKINITLHERCCVRAMERVLDLREDVVAATKAQKYLRQWATWWSQTCAAVSIPYCLWRWVERAFRYEPSIYWLGSGLLFTYGRGRMVIECSRISWSHC